MALVRCPRKFSARPFPRMHERETLQKFNGIYRSSGHGVEKRPFLQVGRDHWFYYLKLKLRQLFVAI
jgi:hypothetical protein